MGKSIHLLTLEAQHKNRWTYAFANAYVCNRYIDGLSHLRAYTEALKSPLVAKSDKPQEY